MSQKPPRALLAGVSRLELHQHMTSTWYLHHSAAVCRRLYVTGLYEEIVLDGLVYIFSLCFDFDFDFDFDSQFDF